MLHLYPYQLIIQFIFHIFLSLSLAHIRVYQLIDFSCSFHQVVILATVASNISIKCDWTATTSNMPVLLNNTLTPVSKRFLAKEAVLKIAYPLSVPPDVFTAGLTYTFRLSCSPSIYPKLIAYTDIVLPVNSPPYGGEVHVTPTSGYALSTVFAISTAGWVTDEDNLPLGYLFSYQLSPMKGALVLSVLSPKPYISSPLAPGLLSMKSLVKVYGSAIDIYSSAANASATVLTKVNEAEDPSIYLKSVLSKSLKSGNLDLTFQTINLVSSTVSVTNCSGSPNCANLHRASCYGTTNTCGSCLSKYKGVVGDSNSACFPSNSPVGGTGYPCSTNSTCLYGFCQGSACAPPNKACQSISPDTICSGNGQCVFTDASGNTLNRCVVTSPFCTAHCKCIKGYGAVDCSLDPAGLVARENSRVSMCSALVKVISLSPKSTHLFDSVVSALESAFDLTEITSIAGRAECSLVLRFLGTLAKRGYLGGALPVSQQTFTEISSQFVQSTTTTPKTNGRRQLSQTAQFTADVAAAVAGITTGAYVTQPTPPLLLLMSQLSRLLIHGCDSFFCSMLSTVCKCVRCYL